MLDLYLLLDYFTDISNLGKFSLKGYLIWGFDWLMFYLLFIRKYPEKSIKKYFITLLYGEKYIRFKI